MIWTTWRQHRAEAAVGALIFIAMATAMIVVGTIARDRANALGLPACTGTGGDCSDALELLHRSFHTIPPFTAALVAVPLLAGMFWGAPLVSREYERGTHRLAWTQSVSPLRWIMMKIVLIFGIVALAAAGLGLLATWTLDPLTDSFGGRYNSTWYDIQGIVPVACMLFAFSVGIAASALIRRTIPAMAITLVVYAAARIPIHWIRGHFAPAASRTFTIPLSNLLHHPLNRPQDSVTPNLAAGDWAQSVTITDASGHAIGSNVDNLTLLQRYCPNLQLSGLPVRNGAPTTGGAGVPVMGESHVSVVDPGACQSTIQGINFHETLHYQPTSHFWFIQSVESAIFLIAAALLVAVAVFAVTRRRPT